jgi:tetratricopeptide (TPR) repeat protein
MIFILSGEISRAQVFPEVNSPAVQQQKQQEENAKLAMQYYNDQEYEKALELFRELYKKQPNHLNYTYYLFCLITLKEFPEAESLIRGKIKNEPGSYRYHVDLGYLYMEENKPDKATRYFEDLIDGLKPSKAMILEVANAFISRRLYDYAIKTYLKGRELLQYSDPFYSELARVYELSGNYGEMIDEYLELLQYDPSQTELVQGRLQNLLSLDTEGQISDLLREALLIRNQKNPENRYYSEMLLWLSIQRRDFEFALLQAKSLDTRFKEGGQLVFELGNLCLANEEYEVATEAFSYLVKTGVSNPFYTESLTGMLRSKFMAITKGYDYQQKEIEELDMEYTKALDELGRNARTALLMRDQAHIKAFYLNQLEDAMVLLETAVAIPTIGEMTRADLKLELGDIYLFEGDVWEASLLYSQVEKAFKNDPVGHEAKFRNARLSYFIGEFTWSKAQLDVLKAATTKLIANDAMELSLIISDNMDPDSTYTGLSYYSRADLYIYRGQDDRALLTLDSISRLSLSHPLDDDILYRKSEIFIRAKDFNTADSLLEKIVTDYSTGILADNALFRLAELQEEAFNDKDGAMKLYQQLMLDYPGSLFATEARKRYRQLRGDVIN